MTLKVCSMCKKEYPSTLEYFNKSSYSKSGLRSQCKECTKIMNKKNHARYYEENKEKVNKKNMENYYKKNPKEVIPEGYKKCSKCNDIKPKTHEYFNYLSKAKDGFKHQCKECRKKEYSDDAATIKEKRKEYYRNNKDIVDAKNRQYRIDNPKWYRKTNKEYYQANKERMKENSKRSLYRRMKEDKGFLILQRLRKRMYEAMNGRVKSKRTIELIGCSVEELHDHIEKQFVDGMSWDNYGEWHVDHIMPCALFDFNKVEHQQECFNYKNLQPLWAEDNIRKGKKIV